VVYDGKKVSKGHYGEQFNGQIVITEASTEKLNELVWVDASGPLLLYGLSPKKVG
jgi:hypothetical protein